MNHGFLDWDTSDSFTINPVILDVVDQIDNPPPRDYWQEWTAWFRGRKWSLPVLIGVIGLSALIQWIEMLRTVLVWLGDWLAVSALAWWISAKEANG